MADHSSAQQPGFPPGFFDRADPGSDAAFYAPDRFVTHIDAGAIDAVGGLYEELGLGDPERAGGEVLDLMSSWVSHFRATPARLVALGMNAHELAANPQAASWLVHDLNLDPALPFADASFDAATCCVSVDYLTRPVEVFREVARVLRPGGTFAITISNRCFPTKAIRAWLRTGDAGHVDIVREYFRVAGGFTEPVAQLRTPEGSRGDPLWGIWATSTPAKRSG